jgi:hypothetical protein
MIDSMLSVEDESGERAHSAVRIIKDLPSSRFRGMTKRSFSVGCARYPYILTILSISN